MLTGRSSPRWPLLVLAAALLLLFAPVLRGEVFFWGLPTLQFYPWREFAWETLRAGHWPLWNPYNGAGAPLLANYQSGLLYPFNWAGLVLPLSWTMSVIAIAHLFLAACGMWALMGRLGAPLLGRGMSALAFGLSGYLVARLGTYPIISTSAWLPWLLWAAAGVCRARRPRDLGLLALFAGLQLLAGHAQTAWYSLLLTGAFLGWQTAVARPRPWSRLALAAGALLLGAGLAALQLLPTAELLAQSSRSNGVGYDFAMNFSYDPPRVLNWIAPNFFGSPGDGSYVTEGAYFEDAVYIGLIPLVSALAAAAGWAWGRWRRQPQPVFASVPFWLVITAVGCLLALGDNTPVFPWLYRHVPTFGLFQAPVRWHLWTVTAMSALAGIGVANWGRGRWLFFSVRLATAGCAGAAALALFADRLLPPEIMGNDGVQVVVRALFTTAVLGALAGLMTLAQPAAGGWRYRWWMAAALILVAGDLVWAAQGLNPTVPAAFYDPQARSSAEQPRAYWPKAVEYSATFDRYLPMDDYRVAVARQREFRESGLANLNLLDRAPLLNNFDPLQVGHLAAFIETIEASPPEQQMALLQAAGVNAVYALAADGAPRRQALALPAARAWFVERVTCYPLNTAAGQMLSEPGWQPFQEAKLATSAECPTAAAAAVRAVGAPDPNALQVDVHAPAGGFLVIAQTDYPGWEAWVDDQPARIWRANGAFQAVEVPAGTRQVWMVYRPTWAAPGLLISLVSLVSILALLRARNPASAA